MNSNQNKICKFYARGECRHGNNCRFKHVKEQHHPQGNNNSQNPHMRNRNNNIHHRRKKEY